MSVTLDFVEGHTDGVRYAIGIMIEMKYKIDDEDMLDDMYDKLDKHSVEDRAREVIKLIAETDTYEEFMQQLEK